jgi:CRISPR-associated protein Cas2
MKQFVVVAYDISDDRRRQKIAKALMQYGLRCNESVFECLLTDSKLLKMKQQLMKIVDEKKDSILFYYLCMPCVMKRENFGYRPEIVPEIVMV